MRPRSSRRTTLIPGRALVALGCVALLSAPAASALTPGRNVNMVSGTQWPGGDPFLQRQNEPAMATSTRNALHLLAGANDYRTVDLPGLPNGGVTGDAWLGVFKSFDGGARWQSVLLPGYPQDTSAAGLASPLKGFQAGADPVVRAGTNGLFYYSGIVFDRDPDAPSMVFVARFIDLNNKEGVSFDINSASDPIRYIDAVAIDLDKKKHFIDKPWIAVDVPRGGAGLCDIDVPLVDGTTTRQTFPAGNVYLAYTLVHEKDTPEDNPGKKGFGDKPPRQKDPIHTKLHFARSTDCGGTWSTPMKLSEGHKVNQGSSIAIDPHTGRVYVVWRRFATVKEKESDAILAVMSDDGGRKFTKPVIVASINPFEQGASRTSLRTSAFPTAAVDPTGRVLVAWSERSGPSGDGRIVLSHSTDGTTWSAPVGADNPPGARGHQFMPSLTSNQGRVMLLYYEQRLDHTFEKLVCPGPDPLACAGVAELVSARELAGDLATTPPTPDKVFTNVLADAVPAGFPPLLRRHAIDVFALRIDPGAPPVFGAPARVSRYALGSPPEPGAPIKQLQFNPPNFPLFARGTAAFIGDYIDIAGAPPFVRSANGTWRHNTDPSNAAVYHAVWTDNRDVRPPPDGDWTRYTPVGSSGGTSLFDPTQAVPPCEPGREGMRNQNIYTSRITDGLLVGALQNSKPLGVVPNPLVPGETIDIQRAFAIIVQNGTDAVRHYRLSLEGPIPPPVGFEASFLQFDPLDALDVSIAARSSISRMVFVRSPNDARASVDVRVAEIGAIGAPDLLPDGLRSGVVLNPDPTAPDIINPDIINPDIINPDIINAEVYNPDIINPDIINPDIINASITSPDIINPDIINPDIINPDIINPDIINPDIINPDIINPDIINPDIINGSIRDVSWTVTNNGNTAAAYDVNLLLNGAVPEGFKLQLILHKVTTAPTAFNCSLGEKSQNVLVASISNPVFSSPADVTGGDPTNPDITNATLALAPGEVGRITLRVVDPDSPNPVAIEEFIQDNAVAPVTVSQSVNTEDVVAGETEPPVAAPLTIVTTTLPGAVLGIPYGETLQTIGGTPPRTWSVSAGALPPGLALAPATGTLAGTPEQTGSFAFTARVVDSATTPQFDTQALTLAVTAPDLVVESLTHDPAEPTTEDLITFTAIVRNTGDGPAGASLLELTVQGEEGGVPATLLAVPPLAPGAAATVQHQAILASAEDYLSRATADANGDVVEVDEENNLRTESFTVLLPLPDLVVESLTHNPATPTTADLITFTATVRNIGAGPAGPSTLGFKVGGEPFGAEGTLFSVPALAPGATFVAQRQEALEVAQNYLNTAVADFAGDVAETDEENNTTTDSYTVVPIPAPDFIIVTGTPAATPQAVLPGGGVTLSAWSIRNRGGVGSNSAGGTIRNGFYLSTDATLTAEDTLLDSNFNTNNVLEAGEQFDWGGPTLAIPPGTPPGSYYIGILVDDRDDVAEFDEGNNFAATALAVLAAGVGTATIDGVVGEGEWDGAACFDFAAGVPEGGTTPATLCLMNDAGSIYFLLSFARSPDPQSIAAIELDQDDDGLVADDPGDDYLSIQQPGGGGTLADLHVAGGEACAPASVCIRHDLDAGGTLDGSGAFGNNETRSIFEFAHPLFSEDQFDIALVPGDQIRVRAGLFIRAGLGAGDFGITFYPAPAAGLAALVTERVFAISGASATGLRGGGGGSAFNDACAAGEALVGVRYSVEPRGWIGTIGAICGRVALSLDPTPAITIDATRSLPLRGLADTAPLVTVCPVNQVLVGFAGRAGLLVDQLALRCAPLSAAPAGDGFAVNVGAVTTGTPFGGGGGSAFAPANCPAGQAANVANIRAGDDVDAFGLTCGTPRIGLTQP